MVLGVGHLSKQAFLLVCSKLWDKTEPPAFDYTWRYSPWSEPNQLPKHHLMGWTSWCVRIEMQNLMRTAEAPQGEVLRNSDFSLFVCSWVEAVLFSLKLSVFQGNRYLASALKHLYVPELCGSIRTKLIEDHMVLVYSTPTWNTTSRKAPVRLPECIEAMCTSIRNCGVYFFAIKTWWNALYAKQ